MLNIFGKDTADITRESQITTTAILDPITNTYGQSIHVYDDNYDCHTIAYDPFGTGKNATIILYNGNPLDEARASEYMKFMTGSGYVPYYGDEIPSMFIYNYGLWYVGYDDEFSGHHLGVVVVHFADIVTPYVVPSAQVMTSFVQSPIINIYGHASGYQAESTTYEGNRAFVIKFNGEYLNTISNTTPYMRIMTGSEYVPINIHKDSPIVPLWIFDNAIWKVVFDGVPGSDGGYDGYSIFIVHLMDLSTGSSTTEITSYAVTLKMGNQAEGTTGAFDYSNFLTGIVTIPEVTDYDLTSSSWEDSGFIIDCNFQNASPNLTTLPISSSVGTPGTLSMNLSLIEGGESVKMLFPCEVIYDGDFYKVYVRDGGLVQVDSTPYFGHLNEMAFKVPAADVEVNYWKYTSSGNSGSTQ